MQTRTQAMVAGLIATLAAFSACGPERPAGNSGAGDGAGSAAEPAAEPAEEPATETAGQIRVVATETPYGVCAHLHRVRDPGERREECRQIASTGIGRVRFDFEWWRIQKTREAPLDFSHYDAVVADATARGLTVLPILFDVPKWADPVWEHLDDWERFIEATVARYGDVMPEVEIWNEENLEHFWKHHPDPGNYLKVLRAAYRAAKRARPDVRVLFGGTAGVPLDFIGKVYELGGADSFDVMNIHPYSHPIQPEGNLDAKLEQLRALMAKYGDAGKPIVITEHGWPTHDARVSGLNILRAGLEMARPGKTGWRAAYAATSAGANGAPPTDIAESIEAALPPGSSVEACFGARLRERIAAGDLDLVVYPFDETFPADTFDEVRRFVDNGGVLADLGGMPMWFAVNETAPGVFVNEKDSSGKSTEKYRNSLKISESAWWIDGALPKQDARAFPTPLARDLGYKGDPAGERVSRYQTPALLRDGDEFLPILETEDANGKMVAAASVTRLDGGRRGCVIVSGAKGRGAAGSAGEDGQARYLARAMAIAFAEGVGQYFWYEFRGRETDPQYSEHHFGLTHQNFTPKPAWGAYRNFILARPVGSRQRPGEWRDGAAGLFFPQWTRPDGTDAGIIWKTGRPERMALRFNGGDVKFRDYTGRLVPSVKTGDGLFQLLVSENPVYFEGAVLER
ncbi:MAG: hypothetical protein IKH04_01095 [Kiritimatiellae bacterium]|nr:hypothetical protein [Kiritimatiellia bacterium]